jgi:superfamily I DNA and/or RNA helicase
VPHRAQRALLQEAIDRLKLERGFAADPRWGMVDTVERYQGGERDAIVISATESDPAYLAASSGFLLDARRFTVALSRARKKLILVASASVFSTLSSDEETFANARIWKDLLRRTCTVPLWSGERLGHRVEVWGNDYEAVIGT